jgi:hypothetical protein
MIGTVIWPYGTCVVRASYGPPDHDALFCGSGTFVRRGDSYYLLTAGHVWREVRKGPEFSLVFASRPHDFKRSISYYPARLPEAESAEWGPDCVLVRIPDADVGTIAACCAFYDLERVPDGTDLSKFDLFALVGVPAAISRPPEFKRTCFFCARPTTALRSTLRYFDVDVLPSDQFQIPPSLGGVSGGGLWGITLAHPGTQEPPMVNDAALLGVAFYQFPPHRVRCQGIEHGLQ